MEIIETPVFTRLIADILFDDDYRQLQWGLIVNPELGAVIPGGGGIRKVRWNVSGKGKRGANYLLFLQPQRADIHAISV